VRLAGAYRLIAELTGQVERLTALNERLSARVDELERRARQDSSTSSRPPSSDGPHKKKKRTTDRSLRERGSGGRVSSERDLRPLHPGLPGHGAAVPARRDHGLHRGPLRLDDIRYIPSGWRQHYYPVSGSE
jgi:hypothetical protein